MSLFLLPRISKPRFPLNGKLSTREISYSRPQPYEDRKVYVFCDRVVLSWNIQSLRAVYASLPSCLKGKLLLWLLSAPLADNFHFSFSCRLVCVDQCWSTTKPLSENESNFFCRPLFIFPKREFYFISPGLSIRR